MFFDPAAYPFTAVFESSWQTFDRELAALSRDDFIPWPRYENYTGTWLTYPLIEGRYSGTLGVDLDRNRRRCPGSYELVAEMAGVELCGFSWLDPGCHIEPHEDLFEAGVLRCHLGLLAPPECYIAGGGERRTWAQGKCLVFDPARLHEARNPGSEPRVVLLTDIRLSAWDL